MFASSSTALTRSVATVSAQAQRSFSTSTPAFASRRRQLVELLTDHERLGIKGDRVLVAPGYARHRLVPFRIARHVPFWKEYKILPFKGSLANPKTPPTPTPAEYAQSGSIDDDVLQLAAPDPSKPESTKKERPAKQEKPTPKDLIQKLDDLPEEHVFHLRTVTNESPVLHGSLTLGDVGARLEQFSLLPTDVEINWSDGGETGDRMKELGRREVEIIVKGRGKEVYTIDVVVERLEA